MAQVYGVFPHFPGDPDFLPPVDLLLHENSLSLETVTDSSMNIDSMILNAEMNFSGNTTSLNYVCTLFTLYKTKIRYLESSIKRIVSMNEQLTTSEHLEFKCCQNELAFQEEMTCQYFNRLLALEQVHVETLYHCNKLAENNERLANQIETLLRENDELQSKACNLSKLNRELALEIKFKSQTHAAEIDSLSALLDTRSRELLKTKDQLFARNIEVIHCYNHIDRLKDENDSLNLKVSEKDVLVNLMQRQNASLSNQLSKLSREFIELEQDTTERIDSLSFRNITLENVQLHLTSDLNNSRTGYLDLKLLYSEVTRKLTQQELLITTITTENRNLHASKQQITNEFNTLEREAAYLSDSNTEKLLEIAQLNTFNSLLVQETFKLQSQVDTLNVEIADLQTLNNELASSLATLNQSKIELLAKHATEKISHHSIVSQLNSELIQLKSTIEDLQNRITCDATVIRNLENEFQKSEANFTILNTCFMFLEQEYNSIRSKYCGLCNFNSTLTQGLKSIADDLQCVRRVNQKVENQNSELLVGNDQLKDQVAVLHGELATLKDASKLLRQKLQTERESNTFLKQQMQCISNEKIQLLSTITSIESSRQTICDSYKNVERFMQLCDSRFAAIFASVGSLGNVLERDADDSLELQQAVAVFCVWFCYVYLTSSLFARK
ncbi:hypothetical protein RCL1_001510 [Eukaryota sp. TZLM3-RCL]